VIDTDLQAMTRGGWRAQWSVVLASVTRSEPNSVWHHKEFGLRVLRLRVESCSTHTHPAPYRLSIRFTHTHTHTHTHRERLRGKRQCGLDICDTLSEVIKWTDNR
jgi:hypothetical protein